MKYKLRRRLTSTALATLLAACGGDDSSAPPSPPQGPVTITQPAGFASDLTGVVALHASSSDASTTLIEFQIDGTPLAVDSAPPFDATVDSSAFASGQHVLRARGPEGQAIELRACMVCDVVDGRITRLDEYLDGAAVAHVVSML